MLQLKLSLQLPNQNSFFNLSQPVIGIDEVVEWPDEWEWKSRRKLRILYLLYYFLTFAGRENFLIELMDLMLLDEMLAEQERKREA